MEIIFRHITEDVPSLWMPIHWYVEAHMDDCGYPAGTAYVSDFSDGALGCPWLDYIQVSPMHQRQGVATALIKSCQERWPNIELSEAATEEGAALLSTIHTCLECRQPRPGDDRVIAGMKCTHCAY